MATKSDPITEALSLPNGGQFYQCALQVNPHHYAETYRGKASTESEETYAHAIVQKAKDLGIAVLAITDHNNVSGVPAFKEAAKDEEITVLPGFELSSSEGVHFLCIYGPEIDDNQLERYLGEFGIRGTDPSSQITDKSVSDLLGLVRDQGGISIAAHVTNDGGLFRSLRGQARIQAWTDRNLLAVQIPGPLKDLPEDLRPIIENRNQEYRRPRGATDDDLAVAVINARDVAQPDDLENLSASSWIKMSQVGVEGLRQAFLDPGSRIRLNSDPIPEEHSEILALAWEGGFLDGARLHLNGNLNVLVGGRGTGKSTIVESMRYVLGLDPIGDEARKGHDGIIRHVLRSGTKISMEVRTYRPSKRDYRIERTVPNPPVVRDENSQVSNLLPTDLLPRVEVYGQHEISELTRSKEKLTRLLDRFVEDDGALNERKAGLRRDLERSRLSILSVSTELQQIDDRLAALPGLEETLERFQEAGLEVKLQEQSLLVREERILNMIPDRLQPIRESLESLQRDLPIDRTFLSSKALEGLANEEILRSADKLLEELSIELEKLAQSFADAIQNAESALAGIRSNWDEKKNEAQASYEQILRELQKSRVDGEEFIKLRRQIEELRPLEERHKALQRSFEEQINRRRTLLAEWEDVKAEGFRMLDRAAKLIGKRLQDTVQVSVAAIGDREPLAQLLRDEIGGRLSEAIDILSNAEDLSLPKLVHAMRQGSEGVQEAYGITPAQADRLVSSSSEVLMRIEELELPATTSISLNTAPAGESPIWQELDDLSTGQKATAVLLLLLLESDAPLIVDQPEDDLDNRFITEGVVPRIRAEKRRRQFVFSTHNANIPVLGDAELILGLSASGEADEGRARVSDEHMGSIDSRSVRELVEEILEGGKEAFEMRRRKYGF